ncbi:MAG: MBL fold metallo-hydrolase [Chloroflexi bacterium]|nr:MBL fold metallo-hydrolase [Chloroflexota bacterium]
MSSVHLQPHGLVDDNPPPALKELSKGIYAYVQLDGSWGLNNPGFIVGSKGVFLIDTCFTERRSKALKAAIESVTDRPVRTMLNTHHHGDHTWGNYLFPETTIISHRLTREETIQTGLASKAFFPTGNFGDVEVEPAFITYEDKLTAWVDDLRVEIEFLGPAHTTNDSIAWIPDRKLLFSGDLVFNHCTPFIVQGSLVGHLRALQRLRALQPEIVVSGHGDVCGPEGIENGVAYLQFVQDSAQKAWDAGLTPFEAAQKTELGRFGEWHEKERFVANLHRAYSEIRGEPLGMPLSLVNVMEEMIIMNDGQPLRCLA